MNETITIFGGFIRTGGILRDSNGKTLKNEDGSDRRWYGFNIMLAECKSGSLPMKASIVKGLPTDSLMEQLTSLSVGDVVTVAYHVDLNQKDPVPRVSSITRA